MKTELVKLSGYDRRLCLAFQFRLSKIFHDGQKQILEEEYDQLWLICLHFLDQMNEQLPKKLKGHKLALMLLLRFLSKVDFKSIGKQENLHNLHFYCRSLLLDPFEYFGLKFGLFEREIPKITFKILPKRLYKPAPYIGVGYKDKGNTSNPAENGVLVSDLMKANLTERKIAFHEIDYNTSFDIIETCEEVDNAVEDSLMDF
jgi:hypothetical protein